MCVRAHFQLRGAFVMGEPGAGGVVPGRHDREAREKALIDAATAVFAERGYDAATTREIAGRAACSEGLIHRYFGGKRGLLRAVLRSRSATVVEEFAAAIPECDDPFDEIHAILREYLLTLATHQQSVRVHLGRALIDPEIGVEVGTLLEDRRAALVRERLVRHVARGTLAPDTDVAGIASAISGMGFAAGFMGAVVFQRPREEIERTLENFARTLVRGLAPGVAPNERRA